MLVMMLATHDRYAGKPEVVEVGFGRNLNLTYDNIGAVEDKYMNTVVVFEAEMTDLYKNPLNLVPNKRVNAS